MTRRRLPSTVFRFVLPAVLMASACVFTGCTPAMQKFSPSNIWHNMQPHRLQQWNRGPGMSTDAYFSVSDPTDDRDGDLASGQQAD